MPGSSRSSIEVLLGHEVTRALESSVPLGVTDRRHALGHRGEGSNRGGQRAGIGLRPRLIGHHAARRHGRRIREAGNACQKLAAVAHRSSSDGITRAAPRVAVAQPATPRSGSEKYTESRSDPSALIM